MTNASDNSQRLLQAVAVFVAVALFYKLLLSPLPVDDMPRYVDELRSNRFHWDVGHLWLQPLALLLFQAGFKAVGVVSALEALNVASVALGTAVLFCTLRRLGQRVAKALLACALVVFSFNLLSLGPTGHIKLMAFPALALSIHYAALWDQSTGEGRWRLGAALASGIWLGAGTNLLISLLPSAFFVPLCMVLRARTAGRSRRDAFTVALVFALGLAVAGIGLLLLAYAAARATHTTPATGLLDFVLGGLREKEGLRAGYVIWREMPMRFAFSLVNNFAFLPTLGALTRAWMWGLLPAMNKTQLLQMALQCGLAMVSVAALAGLCVAALRDWRKPGRALLLAGGFVLGAATFSAYYNLNDPEHWFQFTLPVALIAAQVTWRWLTALVFAVWLPVFAAGNMLYYGVPKAAFDLPGRQQAFTQSLGGKKGLYVGFAAYPGEPDSSLLSTRGAATFIIDLEFDQQAKGNIDALLVNMDAKIDAAFARGGRVLVFRALDPFDFRGPILHLSLQGVTRERLRSHLGAHYTVVGPLNVAGFPAWEIKPQQANSSAPPT